MSNYFTSIHEIKSVRTVAFNSSEFEEQDKSTTREKVSGILQTQVIGQHDLKSRRSQLIEHSKSTYALT